MKVERNDKGQDMNSHCCILILAGVFSLVTLAVALFQVSTLGFGCQVDEVRHLHQVDEVRHLHQVDEVRHPHQVDEVRHPQALGLHHSKSSGVRVASAGMTVTWPDPPPHDQFPKVARYIVHIADWISLATISTHSGIEGFPFANVFSMSDGTVGNSSGVPYLYLTQLELSVKDLKEDSRASMTISEAQSDYCHQQGFDPQDPRCAHVILTGTIIKVQNGTAEEKFAKKALFSRHPEMTEWPKDHNWFFGKLNITHIYLLDYFGGAEVVGVEQYFNTSLFP